ncbi:MAG: hypothetical protein WD896_02980, partial [Parcubacteria group bacterium]
METIFRFYATAAARNEPLSTYLARITDRNPTSDPVAELTVAVAPRLHQVAAERTKANQARQCRVILLEYIERSASDHYIGIKADESLREVCLAAMSDADREEDVRRRHGEIISSYFNALWVEASLACLYEEQFSSYMPLDSFSSPYRAMTEMYTRVLCAKLFSRVMGQHGRPELQKVSQLYEDACADNEVRELAEIRKNYYDAIKKGFVEGLYPVQRHFAAVAESVQSSVKAAFDKPNANENHESASTDGALQWSSNPGAHETHLRRRHNNPYFPESRRKVLPEDLAEAKRKDKEDYVACEQLFEQLGKEIEALSSTTTSGDLLGLRERIDDLIFFSMGVGGPEIEVASKADRLREAVISDLRAAFAGDEETLSNIEKADAYHKDRVRAFYIPVIAQILRKNGPIPQEETIPAILSEDPSAIAIFINSLPKDSRPPIEVEALKIMREALDNGHVDPQFEEKIFA